MSLYEGSLLKCRATTIFIISLVLLSSGSGISYLLITDTGTVNVKEVNLTTETGLNIHTTVQVPKRASATDPVPAIIIIHGLAQCKEWLYSFSLELARRNFVVVSIDAASHGNSDSKANRAKDRGGLAALSYVESLPYVSDKIGVIGHSMGAGIALQAIQHSTVEVDALVTVGGGWVDPADPWGNQTYPKNLLYTVGKYDELFNVSTLPTTLQPLFGTDSLVKPGKLYGSFENGTARKLVIGNTNHLFETIDPKIIRETIGWMQNSLRGTNYKPNYPKKAILYPYHILAGFIRVIGLIMSIFPLGFFLLDLNIFQDLRKPDKQGIDVNSKHYTILALFYSIGGLVTILPGFLFSNTFPFPHIFGGFIFFWFLTSCILFGVALLAFYHFITNEDTSWGTFGVKKVFSSLCWKEFLKSALIAFLINIWLYTIILIVDKILFLDFRAFLPFLNDLTVQRTIITPLYFLVFLPYFIIEGNWLFGILDPQKTEEPMMKREPQNSWIVTHWSRLLPALMIKISPFLAVILLQAIGSVIVGKAFISGFLGFQLLFFYVLVPYFIVSVLIQAWGTSSTKRVYLGGWVNALLLSWAISALLPLSYNFY